MRSHSFRLLSYNIRKGLGALGWREALENLRAAIRSTQAELVLLQEVRATAERAQFEYLADSVWRHYAYGQNAIYPEDRGHHGNATLSRYPIAEWSNTDLSINRWERRGLLRARLQVPSAPTGQIEVWNVHLNLLSRARLEQVERIGTEIARLDPATPLLLAGDFNDWDERLSARLAEFGLEEASLRLRGEHLRTFPGWWPKLRLDRLYLRRLVPVSCQALSGKPWSTLSDHSPILAEVSW